MDTYFQDVTRSNYNFDPIKMGDGTPRQFEIAMNDVAKHNFFMTLTQTVVPRKCMRIADSETEEPTNVRTKTLYKEGDNEDIEFDFRILRIDGCSDEFKNSPLEGLGITTQPPIDDDILQ